MESGLKSRVLAVVAMAAVVGCSLVGSVAGADAPAPSPVSGAVSVAAPAAVASLSVLAFGFLFC
ncbi:unnamed protein product [Spirodela intermedia]|uniref:Uncharacterized protein n=1 Tax=Spirodela intermedia TaxID=51605 RepID=A0A7I8JYD2_SPIIN|nr:unnamed protein product [Spirodela intermedia]